MTPVAFKFGLLGNIISFMVFLAPVPTFYEIYKKKSSEGFQSVPYVIGLFSAMLWIYYALLKPGNTLLLTINSVGCVVHSIYTCLHLFYASKRSRMQTLKLLLLLNVIGLGLIVMLTHFLTNGTTRGEIVGWICLVFSLCVFVAPLGILRRVIRTKSVEYMSFLLSFFLTLSAVMWFFYGFLLQDYNIAIPNVLGFSLGVIQMVLYVIYKKNKGKKVVEVEKLPGTQTQIIVIEEDKIPELKIVDVKLNEAIVEIIPMLPGLADNDTVVNLDGGESIS